MTSRRSHFEPRGLATPLPLALPLLPGGLPRGLLGGLVAGLLAAGAAAAGDWVTFTDETSTRLVSSPDVGIDDVQEKDIVSGDVDKDGDPDIIVVRKEPFTNEDGFRNVLFMNEDGVMTDRTATLAPDFLDPTNDRDVELADVDGDGWLDIITGGTFHEPPRILMNRRSVGGVWQGFEWDPDRLPELLSPQGVGPFFCGMAVGDLTGNGRPDIYFTDYGGLIVGEGNDLDDRLLINNGAGFFTDQTAARLAPGLSVSLFGTDADIGDVNGDGWNDIIKNDATGFFGLGLRTPDGAAEGGLPNPAVTVFYNDPSDPGHFTSFDTVYDDTPYMVAVADFTQDDRLDLFVVDDNQDRYLINTGNDGSQQAQFTTHNVVGAGTTGFGGNVKFADLDHDGVLDVLVADVDTDIPGCDRRLVALRGQGPPPSITYSDPLGARPWTPNGTFDVEALDINGDGGIDLWIGTCTGTRIFMGEARNIFLDGFESGDTSAWDSTVP